MSNIYCAMGRIGDLLCQLPMLHADYQRTGERQRMMVAKEFASLLDGCSYIEPVIFDGGFEELGRAVQQARGMSDEVVVTSLHGSAEDVEKYAYSQIGQKHATAENFQKEAWKLAGRLDDWDECLPLVFDKRDKERERRLLAANGFFKKGPKKPVILLAVDGGVTAPFPYARLLRELVTLKFGDKYRVLDLPMVEKPDGRIYDLLALYENAALLIAIDSMPLHLAWACPKLPVFALANDKPTLWHGSAWRPNHLWFCRYSDWPERSVEMLNAIENDAVDFQSEADDVFVWKANHRRTHCGAQAIPVFKGMTSREADGFPFVKDVVRMALQRSRSDDTDVFLSRQDVSVNGATWPSMNKNGVSAYAYRIHKGQFHPIVDLFSAPKSLWQKIMPEIPDLILDNKDVFWSQALMAIFKRNGAVDATGACEYIGESK
jgi:hypothetical protein